MTPAMAVLMTPELLQGWQMMAEGGEARNKNIKEEEEGQGHERAEVAGEGGPDENKRQERKKKQAAAAAAQREITTGQT